MNPYPYSIPATDPNWPFWCDCYEADDPNSIHLEVVEITSPTPEGWYDPRLGDVDPNDHDVYFQYNMTNINWTPEPFIQIAGTTYWLEMCAWTDPNYPGEWGWKSSEDHWNDDAVWRDILDPNWVWRDLYEPSAATTDTFWANVSMGGVSGGGSGYGGGQWYEYVNTGWWNQWFYDGVYDPTRVKVVTISFDFLAMSGGNIEIALNYSTPEWSALGNPYPPIPPLTPSEEALYIERVTLLESNAFDLEGLQRLTYTIRDYNPEWVSIDIRAETSVEADISGGIIVHDCVGQSLDLAFVITGEELPVPTVTEWGLIVMTLLLLTAGTIIFARQRRRRPAAA